MLALDNVNVANNKIIIINLYRTDISCNKSTTTEQEFKEI